MTATRPLGRIALALLAGWVVLAALLAQVAGSRAWARLEARRDDLRAAAVAEDPTRPVLRGRAGPGEAWDDYEIALRQVASLPPELDATIREALDGGADRAVLARILEDHGAAIDALRRGAGRERGARPLERATVYESEFAGLIGTRHLAHLAVARSRLAREADRFLEAGEILLDVLRFAQDLGRNSTLLVEMLGIASGSIALEELSALVSDPAAGASALVELARQLEVLEGTWPSEASIHRNESLHAATACLEGEIQVPRLMAWRHGFSSRWLVTSAALEADALERRLGELGALDWPSAQARIEAIEREIETSANPAVAAIVSGDAQVARRTWRARFRLVLAAARARVGLDSSAIPDPFGAVLREARDGDRIRFWSLGRNGVDDGGAGTVESSGLDLVLEVPARAGE